MRDILFKILAFRSWYIFSEEFKVKEGNNPSARGHTVSLDDVTISQMNNNKETKKEALKRIIKRNNKNN